MPTYSGGALLNGAEHPVRTATCGALAGREPQASLAYEAFCRDHWPVYRAFGTAAAGCNRVGADIARGALCDLAFQWDAALRTAAPAALAWELLSAKSGPHHTRSVRRLCGVLGTREVDALLLRYRVGLSTPEAAHAMGLDEARFDLLRARGLRGITQRTLW